jgi:hypothetical protein
LNAGNPNRATSRLSRGDAISQRPVAEVMLARGRSYLGPWPKLNWPVAD